MDSTRISETSLDLQRTRRRYIPENRARDYGLPRSLNENAGKLLTLGDGRPIASFPCLKNQDM
jgi:hypothetical protein